MKPTEEEVKRAIREILADRKAYSRSLNYAVDYCREALCMTPEELRVQCLYILNNIIHWRNPQASRIRELLKQFVEKEF
jgi:hypothetical protein